MVVESGFGIVIISTIPERIEAAYRCSVNACIGDREYVSPRVIRISGDRVAVCVIYLYDITLKVLAVIVNRTVDGYALRGVVLIVGEFQYGRTVFFFKYLVAVNNVFVNNAVDGLFDPYAVCVVVIRYACCTGRKRCKLASVLPCKCIAAAVTAVSRSLVFSSDAYGIMF